MGQGFAGFASLQHAGLSSHGGITLRVCQVGKDWNPNIWILHWPGLTQVRDFWGFNQSLLLESLAESGREMEVMP